MRPRSLTATHPAPTNSDGLGSQTAARNFSTYSARVAAESHLDPMPAGQAMIRCRRQRATVPMSGFAGQSTDTHVKPDLGYHAPSHRPV
jgi:hypothetical protein